MNLNLKKFFVTLGIATLALTANVVTTPTDSLAASEKVVKARSDEIKEAHFSIDAANGETFVNYANLVVTPDVGYYCITSTNGKDPQWYGIGDKRNNYTNISATSLTKTTTVKVKCIKYSDNDKTLVKRLAKAKVYTYKFNVINTGVNVVIYAAEEPVVDGMSVCPDYAEILLGYPGKALNYGAYDDMGFYKAKGKVLTDTMKTKKVSTKKYDKKYAKLATQTLYYTLDGSTPTTKSKKVAAGKMKAIKVTKPGVNTLKVMGAKEKKVYTYTFYVDAASTTAVDVPEAAGYYAGSYVTPQNVSITGCKYFKTCVAFEVYDGLEMEYFSVELNPGESAEFPYNHFEGKVLRYAGCSSFF